MTELNFVRIMVNLSLYQNKLLEIDLIHLECSALTGENIETIFNLMTKNILNKLEEGTIQLNDNQLLNKIVIKADTPIEDKREQYCANC